MRINGAMSVPTEPGRLRAFAEFFKNYMSLAALVTASLPIPVAAMKLIPAFEAQSKFLSVYASLFCFLTLAFLFQCRHALSHWMFSRGSAHRTITLLPLLLIAASMICAFSYHATVEDAIRQVQGSLFTRGVVSGTGSDEILKQTDYLEIPHAVRLASLYLGIFLTAEAAFVLMALREYLQDLLGMDEKEMLRG